MRIGVLGVNFKSCKMAIREAVARACQKKLALLSPEVRRLNCVVLSTCNRVEIYFSAEDLAEAHSAILNLLKQEIAFSFEHLLYSYFSGDCFLHLAQVTSGLDSAIVSESEIQRQVKIAYEKVAASVKLPSSMHYLFQKCLHLGKRIRSDFLLTSHAVTLPKLLFKRGQRMLFSEQTPILFVGNSQVNRQAISFFKYKGYRELTLSSRFAESASRWAANEEIAFLHWEEKAEFGQFPWIISGGSGPGYAVADLSSECKTQLICDLGVPRTVEPSLKERLTVCDMEDFTEELAKEQEVNHDALVKADQLILARVHFYVDAFLQRGVREPVCV